MNFFSSAQTGLNAGDILFQLIAFGILLAIPSVILIVFFIFKRRSDRLKRVEEKLDQLLSAGEKKT